MGLRVIALSVAVLFSFAASIEGANEDGKVSPVVACQGPPTSGDCKKFIVGYTFDPVSNSCKEFGNGGCSMTANGFGKIEDCEATCNPVLPCQGPPTSGNCKKLFKGFTFDPVSMKCKRFSAGGCDMTANGFAKKKDCKATCM